MNSKKNFKFSLNSFLKQLLVNVLRFFYPKFYTSKLYNFLISQEKGKVHKLVCMQNLPNYGNIERGQLVIHGEIFTKDSFQSFKSFVNTSNQSVYQKDIHDFRWLSDLKAVNTIVAQERALYLMSSWLSKHGNTDAVSWDPFTTSQRLFYIAYNYDFIANLENIAFHQKLYSSINKQVNHIYNYAFKVKNYRLFSFLVNVAIINHFTSNEKLFKETISLIKKYLHENLLPDGFFSNRNIVRSVDALYSLIMLEEVYLSSKMVFPKELRSAIDKIALTIKSVRHPDGNLPIFNGSYEINKNKIDILLLKSEIGGVHEVSNIRYGGYATILTKNAFIITDTGSPHSNSPCGFNSLLSTEVSINKQRLIVNRGYPVNRSTQNFKPSCYQRDIHSGVYFYNNKGNSIKLTVKDASDIKTKIHNSDNKQSINCNYSGLCKKYGITYNREITTETEDSILFEELITTADVKKIQSFGLQINLHSSVEIVAHNNNEVLVQMPDHSRLVIKATKPIKIGKAKFYGDYNRITTTNYIDIPLEFDEKGQTTVLWGIKYSNK